MLMVRNHTLNSEAIRDVKKVLWEGWRSEQEKQAQRFPGICQVESGVRVKVYIKGELVDRTVRFLSWYFSYLTVACLTEQVLSKCI